LQERTDRNKWGLPGGCQDLGEDLKDTAVREAYEETGIRLDSSKIKLIDTLSGASRKTGILFIIILLCIWLIYL